MIFFLQYCVQLLGRVFNILRENNPELAGDRRRTVMRPPQVLREGTKKTVFVNFMDLCKTYVFLLLSILFFPFLCCEFLIICRMTIFVTLHYCLCLYAWYTIVSTRWIISWITWYVLNNLYLSKKKLYVLNDLQQVLNCLGVFKMLTNHTIH